MEIGSFIITKYCLAVSELLPDEGPPPCDEKFLPRSMAPCLNYHGDYVLSRRPAAAFAWLSHKIFWFKNEKINYKTKGLPFEWKSLIYS